MLTESSPVEAGTIDRDWYRDPAALELEKERIFRRVWHFACLQCDVPNPGDYFTLTVADQPIVIVRGKDHVLRAFLNSCTHRGSALTEDCAGSHGNCGNAFVCIYHAWSFDTTGRLIGVPHQEAYGPAFGRDALGLVPVRLDTIGSAIFVALEPLHPTLRGFLGEAYEWMEPAVTDIEVIGRVSWIYEGNWKLWHENFRDNYHPPFVHRSVRYLQGATPPEGGKNYGLRPGHSMLRWQPKGLDYARYDRSVKDITGKVVDSKKASPPPLPERAEYRNIIAFFPNLDFQQPTTFAAGLQVCHPLTVDRTRVDILFLAPIGEGPETRAHRLRYAARTTGCWGETSVDDCEVAERTTIGIKSQGTRYSNIARGTAPGLVGDADDEYSLREYYREYRYYLSLEPGATLA